MTNKPINEVHSPKLNEMEEEALREMREYLLSKGEKQYEELRGFLINWLQTTRNLQVNGLNSLRNTHFKLGHSEPIVKWLEETHGAQITAFNSLIEIHQELGNDDLEEHNINMMAFCSTLELFYGDLVTRCEELRHLIVNMKPRQRT